MGYLRWSLFLVCWSGMAGAQTWSNGDYTVTYQGCVANGNENATCTFQVANSTSSDVRNAVFCTGNIAAVTLPGNAIEAVEKRFGTGNTTTGCNSVDVYKGVPLTLQVIFRVPGGLQNIARINYYGKVVSVTPPVTTPIPPVSLNTGPYVATLSDCHTGPQDTVVCTATLRK